MRSYIICKKIFVLKELHTYLQIGWNLHGNVKSAFQAEKKGFLIDLKTALPQNVCMSKFTHRIIKKYICKMRSKCRGLWWPHKGAGVTNFWNRWLRVKTVAVSRSLPRWKKIYTAWPMVFLLHIKRDFSRLLFFFLWLILFYLSKMIHVAWAWLWSPLGRGAYQSFQLRHNPFSMPRLLQQASPQCILFYIFISTNQSIFCFHMTRLSE